ncbi:aminotransferase class IV [Carboxylicivirga sp. M1479]|uniref:aminotransferase class IV n=1 Tax=Carboxylicivirga sp. M1479 TaxID=2594476 RepID=UPI00163DBE8E|nr:aminotransferase class IV [Carboxylicivirga sp. M1479]
MDRTLKSINFFNEEVDEKTICVYEVFRIEQSTPLFINEHLARLQNSLISAGKDIHIQISRLTRQLKTLYSANNISDGNIKLDYRFTPTGESLFMAYFIKSNYPSERIQKDGIVCSFQYAERTKPGAKIYNALVRNKANAIIEEDKAYETILVNKDLGMTEGSRSNLFFIKDNTLITADETVILPGIMRHQIIKLANELGIETTFRIVRVDEIEQMDAAFISGTSPRMLAIRKIDNHALDTEHPIYKNLRTTLCKHIQQQLING